MVTCFANPAHQTAFQSNELPLPVLADPLGQDASSDVLVTTSERQLCRLAIVAAETGARFTRERIAHDPVAWLLSPRMLFGGRRAIDACLEREPFLRATLLHGLSAGLDADPDDLDALLEEEEDVETSDELRNAPSLSLVEGDAPAGGRRLYTAVVDAAFGDGRIQTFCAMIAPDAAEMRSRLRARYGSWLADAAKVRVGFDWSEALTAALVSEATADMLALVAADPASSLAEGLDVQIEQRFAA